MSQPRAMGKSKALFNRLLVLFLGAAFLIQLALLPNSADCLSFFSSSSDVSLGERNLGIAQVGRVERRFTDAGSHHILTRALNPKFVTDGGQFICNLNNKKYPAASSWMNPSAIQSGEGWTTSRPNGGTGDVISAISSWLGSAGLSTTASDYQTVQTRNDARKTGTDPTKTPTLAPMKNIYNLGEGTIIVEDVLNPRAVPEFEVNNYQIQVERAVKMVREDMGMPNAPESEAKMLVGIPDSPPDPSSFSIPDLTSWSDIAYLQMLTVDQSQVINPTTQAQIREALATVSKSLSDVNLNTGGSAVDFEATTDACKALFKTPNGNGGYYLFGQHPQQLGAKTLDKITVFTTTRSARDNTAINGEDTSAWYFMVAQFKDAPSADL